MNDVFTTARVAEAIRFINERRVKRGRKPIIIDGEDFPNELATHLAGYLNAEIDIRKINAGVKRIPVWLGPKRRLDSWDVDHPDNNGR